MTTGKASHQAIVLCQGHENIRASHHKTFEFTTDPAITERGTCLLGVAADYDPRALLRLRGRVLVRIETGGLTDESEAIINPLYLPSDPLIIRKASYPQRRCIATTADKGAKNISRDLVAALQQPSSKVTVSFEEIDPSAAQGVMYLLPEASLKTEDSSPRIDDVWRAVDLVVIDAKSKLKSQIKQKNDACELLPWSKGQSHRLTSALEKGDRVLILSAPFEDSWKELGHATVAAAVNAKALVIPLGDVPTAILGLMASGLHSEQLHHCQDLPKKSKALTAKLQELALLPHTSLCHVEGNSLEDFLKAVATVWEERHLCIGREIAKHNEAFFHGTALDVLEALRQHDALRGSFVAVLPGQKPRQGDEDIPPWVEKFCQGLLDNDVPSSSIARSLRDTFGWKKKVAYSFVLALKEEE